jgi:hypothetical protein
MSLDGPRISYCGTLLDMRIAVRGVVIVRVVALVGLSLIFAGCGSAASDSVPVATDAPSSAIDFTASLIDGSPIVLGEQLAQHPVALWFWAPG